jgi:hypothetical protein
MTKPFNNAEVFPLSKLAAKSADTGQRKSLIFLADLDRSLLTQRPEALFKPMRRLVQKTTNLLWVTCAHDGGQGKLSTPFAGVKDGFLRTTRSEYSGKRIVSLAHEDEKKQARLRKRPGTSRRSSRLDTSP